MKNTIERLRKLEAVATPGPWFIGNDGEQEYDGSSYKVWSRESEDELGDRPIVMTDRSYYNTAPYKVDAEFIVAIVNALPQLLDRLEKLEALVGAAETVKEFSGNLKEDETYWVVENLMDALAALSGGGEG